MALKGRDFHTNTHFKTLKNPMKLNSRYLKLVALVAVGCWATCPLLHAQNINLGDVKAEIGEVEVEMQGTPEIEASGVKEKRSPKKREWLEVELQFETETDSPIGMIPELQINYYLAVDGVQPSVLTESIAYQNVPDREEVYAVVYVSPAGLARIAGGLDKFSKGDVKAVGAELLINGQIVAAYSSQGRSPWWRETSVPRLTGMILAKEKTPYSVLWVDRHVESKQN